MSISTRNVSKLTAFELRQELVKRNALDIPEDNINYKTMLARMMTELVKEEQTKDDIKATDIGKTYAEIKAEEKKIRDEKKREALEKSKLRQQNPDYFVQKKELNKKPELENASTTPPENNDIGADESLSESTPNNDDSDIFRSVPLGRSKIHIR